MKQWTRPTDDQIQQIIAKTKLFFETHQKEAVQSFVVGNQYYPTACYGSGPCLAGGNWTLVKLGRTLAHFVNERGEKFKVKLDGTSAWNVVRLTALDLWEVEKSKIYG